MEERNTPIPESADETVNAAHSREHHHGHHSHSHHSHGHRSHRRRHHRRSSGDSQKKVDKFKRFVRHNRKKLLYIAGALALILVLLVIALLLDKSFHGEGDGGELLLPDESESTAVSLQVEIPLFTNEVFLTNSAVTAYMNADASISANSIFGKYRGEESTKRLDLGMPVKLYYEVPSIADGYSVKKAVLYVADNTAFTGAKVYTLKDTETAVNVYHLKTGTQYYFRFDLTLSNGSVNNVQGSFKTAEGPRVLTVEGAANVRDVGGWKTVDGRRIKQGLMYRGTELDGAVNALYSVTPAGVNTLLAELGIRRDMDLRFKEDNVTGRDALGAAVAHEYYGIPMYSDIFLPEGKTAIRAVFADLANPSNYPVYLHCTYGMDRTGTVCYVLGALLGMTEEDVLRDYQLSSLCHGPLWALDQFNDFVKRFDLLEGATLQKKAETYLLSVGVTPEEINSIRAIFLED